MPRAKKLYYDVALSGAAPSTVVFPTISPDMNGGLLDALPALDGNASANAKQCQELTAFFNLYNKAAESPVGEELTFIDGAPTGDDIGTPGYLFRYEIVNSSFAGPLVLNFTSEIDPDTVTVAYSQSTNPPPFPPVGPETFFLRFGGAASLPPITVTVVGSTIEITNNTVDDRWGTALTGADCELWIILTAGILNMDGNALTNPGRAVYWHFLIDE